MSKYHCNHCNFPLQPCPQCGKIPEPGSMIGKMGAGVPKAYSQAERKRRSLRAKKSKFWKLKG
jgi:hypothetical protein